MKLEKINFKELSKKMPILNSIDLNLCVGCKASKLLCGLNFCPLLKALDLYPDQSAKLEVIQNNSLFGPTPQIFVGANGYPRVMSGPMTSIKMDNDLSRKASNPSGWVGLSFKDIIELRFNLIRGKQSTFVKRSSNIVSNSIHEKLQEISLSTSPVEVEGQFKKLSSFDFTVNPEIQPMGPSGFLNRFEITSNPKIPHKVDSVLHDELKSNAQIFELYSNKFDIYYLQGILSSGITGKLENSKVVPTRWSITATDDMIGKELIPKLRQFTSIDQIEVRQGNILGNYYTVILLPGNYNFENIESWFPGNIFSINSEEPNIIIDREGFISREIYRGKSTYSKQAGGYYAARLPILEHLVSRKRQARILSIREITPEYLIPVGVWEVREGIRLTCSKSPIIFNYKQEILEFLNDKMFSPISKYANLSLNFTQTTLDEFF